MDPSMEHLELEDVLTAFFKITSEDYQNWIHH